MWLVTGILIGFIAGCLVMVAFRPKMHTVEQPTVADQPEPDQSENVFEAAGYDLNIKSHDSFGAIMAKIAAKTTSADTLQTEEGQQNVHRLMQHLELGEIERKESEARERQQNRPDPAND